MSAPSTPKVLQIAISAVRYAVLALFAAAGLLTLAVAVGVIAWATAVLLIWLA